MLTPLSFLESNPRLLDDICVYNPSTHGTRINPNADRLAPGIITITTKDCDTHSNESQRIFPPFALLICSYNIDYPLIALTFELLIIA